MKYLFILPVTLALLLCTTQCKTSKPQEEAFIENVLPIEKEIADSDFGEIETIPSFPGGEKARIKFLNDNLKYPPEAKKWKVEGAPIVGFVVDADGTLVNIKIRRSSGIPLLDEEVLRVTEKMPKWVPAKDKDGRGIPVPFTMRIGFKMKKD